MDPGALFFAGIIIGGAAICFAYWKLRNLPRSTRNRKMRWITSVIMLVIVWGIGIILGLGSIKDIIGYMVLTGILVPIVVWGKSWGYEQMNPKVWSTKPEDSEDSNESNQK
jgi:hypothetical protein